LPKTRVGAPCSWAPILRLSGAPPELARQMRQIVRKGGELSARGARSHLTFGKTGPEKTRRRLAGAGGRRAPARRERVLLVPKRRSLSSGVFS